MGRETISSQELADYTHVNSTQIRRDLSGFGKFGKRGVGYNVDSLVSQIRKILRSTGKHNIALFGQHRVLLSGHAELLEPVVEGERLRVENRELLLDSDREVRGGLEDLSDSRPCRA